ncbi:MAG: hypothetical protein EVA89_37125 [Sandaracinaceae bacterium]|nr:MAG: hypothetical protein EVA89_37125 [Sandaracinaceae bacterium]
MQRKLLIIAAAASFGALFSHQAMAQGVAPAVLPMQGFLTDGDGAPIDGDTSIEVNLYDGDVSPTVLFTETQTVMVDQGHFTAYVGDGGGALDLALFRDNADVWVGIAIEGGTELPRFQLGSVPYAGFAQYSTNAQNLAGMPATDFQARVTGTCAPGQAITAIAGDGTVTCSPTGDITGVAAGVGLMGGGAMGDVTLNVNPAAVQTRVTGTCGAGEAIVGVNVNGTVTCASVGDILGVTAGTGLTGGGASGTVTLGIAASGVTAAEIAPDAVGSSEIAANAVGTSELAPDSVATGAIIDRTIVEADLNLDSATTVDSTVDETVMSRFISGGAINGVSSGRVMIVTGGSTGRGGPAGGGGTATIVCGATTIETISVSGGGARAWTYITPSFALASCSGLDVRVRATAATSPVTVREVRFLPGL